MSKTRVNITAKHIREGHPVRPACCPIALAIMEAAPGCRVEVLNDRIDVINRADERQRPHRWRVDHTNHTRQFVRDFDRGIQVKPCVALLELPEWAKEGGSHV